MVGNPCFRCEDREIGCHATCELYLDWQGKHLENNKKVNKAKAEAADYRRYKMEVCRRSKRHD